MIIFAIIGVIINFIAAYFTKEGESLNQKSVNLHMLEDVLGWIVVLIGAIIMRFTDVSIIDPILSIAVALFILYNAAKNLKNIIDLFLEKTPKEIDVQKLKENLKKLKGVEDIHHIHIWSIDGKSNYATMHVVVDKNIKKLKTQIKEELHKRGITHVTIECETKEEICHEKNCEIKHTNFNKYHNHH